MFYGAKPVTFERARLMRENMTDGELALWARLKQNQLGVRFKPQHPVAFFIVDFYCHELQLALEVDGPIHAFQRQYDESRSDEIQKYGIQVLRFTDYQVKNDLEKVIEIIRNEINALRNSKNY
jgi:very-short-patch-repair endonuclease